MSLLADDMCLFILSFSRQSNTIHMIMPGCYMRMFVWQISGLVLRIRLSFDAGEGNGKRRGGEGAPDELIFVWRQIVTVLTCIILCLNVVMSVCLLDDLVSFSTWLNGRANVCLSLHVCVWVWVSLCVCLQFVMLVFTKGTFHDEHLISVHSKWLCYHN